MREIYFQVLTFAFAQVASYLPESQRGQYPDPELAMTRVVRNITGINAEGTVKVRGGFIS